MTSRAQRGQRPAAGTSRARASSTATSPNFEVKVDEVRVDWRTEVESIAALIVGEILMQVDAGRDVRGQPFKPYSAEHASVRVEKGLSASPVDLRMTGGLLGSVGLRRIEAVRGSGGEVEAVTLVIGPDTTTSRGSKVPHNLVGKYLTDQGRDWLGLSDWRLRELAKQLAARGVAVRIRRT